MKSKLNYLTGVSLKRKVKTKWFVIANILLALMIIAGLNIDTIITSFGGDFTDTMHVEVIDNTGVTYQLIKESLEKGEEGLADTTSSYVVKKATNGLKKAKEKIEKENNTVVLVIDEDPSDFLKAKLISKGYLNTTEYQPILLALNQIKTSMAMQKENISPETLTKIQSSIKLEREFLEKDKNEKGENNEMIMGFIFPVLILPFFMLTLFLVQMIGAEVNDEKTTRGMEIIISNVSPKTHFFSKVIAGNLFVIMQGVLLFLYSCLGLGIRHFIGGDKISGGITSSIGSVMGEMLKHGMGEKLVYVIPLALLLIVLTFVAYALLAGILASITTNTEDFQQLQTPIIIISLVGYYLATMSSVFSGSLLIRIFSYIPYISAILAPSLLMMGEIGIIDIIISIILVLGTNFLLVKYGLKVYKVGILNYSSRGLWKKMFQALKD